MTYVGSNFLILYSKYISKININKWIISNNGKATQYRKQ